MEHLQPVATNTKDRIQPLFQRHLNSFCLDCSRKSDEDPPVRLSSSPRTLPLDEPFF